MKALIVYASTHHGNTKKVVDAIAQACQVETVDATKVADKDLKEYDLIGIASGIYATQFHNSVINFAKKNLPDLSETEPKKKIFYIMTSAMNKDFSKGMTKELANKNIEVLGAFSCVGYNTFGPFKLIGGTGKGHPDEKDLENAVTFYKGILGKC